MSMFPSSRILEIDVCMLIYGSQACVFLYNWITKYSRAIKELLFKFYDQLKLEKCCLFIFSKVFDLEKSFFKLVNILVIKLVSLAY